MKCKAFLYFVLCYFCAVIETVNAQNDTTILTYQSFIENVLAHHPIALQAQLQNDFAETEWLSARGKFDPTIASKWNEKNFDGKHYYKVFDAGFQIPTWYGLAISGGYENTRGVFLNPENKTDTHGLWNLGIEANLLQGLLIDERRAALQQAEVYQKAAENEQRQMLNYLLFNASQVYLQWQLNFNTLTILNEGVQLAETYFEATRQSFLNGAKPAIDTLEAFLTIQDRQLQLQENRIKWAKSQQQLENYLWYNQVPLELQNSTLPESMEVNFFELMQGESLEQILANHPDLLEKQLKIAQYSIEQRLKREKLKPKLKLKYNPLLATDSEGISPNYDFNNYKWGFQFSVPLFQRSERADVQKTGLKIKETELSIVEKQNTLKNKIEANLQTQTFLEQQLNLQDQAVENYRRLLEAEQTKFGYGESSVFLLNKRQEKYVAGRIKRTKLQTKWEMTKMEYWFLIGQLYKLL